MPGQIIDLVSSPEPEPAPKAVLKTKTIVNPPANTVAYEPSWNWDALSANETETLPVSKPPASKSAMTMPARTSTTNGAVKPAIVTGPNANVITIDDSSEDDRNPPPAKRRRVSSSPQPRPSKTAIPKAAGYKRSVSNIESCTRLAGSSKSTNLPVIKHTTKKDTSFNDDITFTSSPDYIAEATRKRKEKRKQDAIKEHDDKSDEEDDLPGLSGIKFHKDKPKEMPKANRAEDEDPFSMDEDKDEDSGLGLPQRSKLDSTTFSKSKYDITSDSDVPSSPPIKKTTKKTNGSSKTSLDKYNADKVKEREAREKKAKAAEKAAAREAEKERKQQEKVEKARQKEKDAETAKVNLKRTDKKISIKEMIVDLPSCLNDNVKKQVRTYLGAKEASHTEYESTLPIIKWRRNVIREWNEEKAMWDAVPKRIEAEDHVMCVLTAKELVDLVTKEEGQDLDAHALRLKAKFDTCKIIYLIEAYASWKSRNANAKKRTFEKRVIAAGPQEPPTASQRQKKKVDDDFIDENLVEDALLRLQVIHGTLIHYTESWNVTAECVLNFTEQISLRPEKLKSQTTLNTTFCMESGQIKTGEDPTDTYVKMLQEMKRITHPIAWGIVSEYPTVQQLVAGLKEHGKHALANCRKSANGNGSFQDGKIGPKISERVYKVFMERDPSIATGE